MIYEDMSLAEVITYINAELLKARTMKEIEENDFNVNERVIAKRLARRNVKKINGQFVLQDGSKMSKGVNKQAIKPISSEIVNNKSIGLMENIELLSLSKKVDELEKALKEMIYIQSGSSSNINNLGLKLYSGDDKPIAKTIRLYKEIWTKIDKVKDQFPHINYQTLLNSLLDEITEKYINSDDIFSSNYNL